MKFSEIPETLADLGRRHVSIGRAFIGLDLPSAGVEYPLVLVHPDIYREEAGSGGSLYDCHVMLKVLDQPRDENGDKRANAEPDAVVLERTADLVDQLMQQLRDEGRFDEVGKVSTGALLDYGGALVHGWNVEFIVKLRKEVDRNANGAYFDPALPLPLPARPLADYSVADILTGYPLLADLTAQLSEPVVVVNQYDPASPVNVLPGTTYTAPAVPVVTATNATTGQSQQLMPGQSYAVPDYRPAAPASYAVQGGLSRSAALVLNPRRVASAHEVTLNGGTTWATASSNALPLPDAGVAAGLYGVRVRAEGNVPASLPYYLPAIGAASFVPGILVRHYAGYWSNNPATFAEALPPLLTKTLSQSSALLDPFWADLAAIIPSLDSFTTVLDTYLQITTAGTYTFSGQADDSWAVWIGAAALAPTMANCTAATSGAGGPASVFLEAGRHRLKLVFGEISGGQFAYFSYSGPGTGGPVNIPAARMQLYAAS